MTRSREGRSEPWNVRVEAEPPAAFLHHPLSVADVLGLLGGVPVAARPDLRAVYLRTEQREDGYEVDGGLWMPLLRGRSRREPFEIDLFGFVYDDESLRVPEVQTVVLWLEEAFALLLEVAGACDADAARETAAGWLVQAAVPYFRRAHRAEARACEDWTKAHAGTRIALPRLAEDTGSPYRGAAAGLLAFCARWGTADPDQLRAELRTHLDCPRG